jgi:hypothetical protein
MKGFGLVFLMTWQTSDLQVLTHQTITKMVMAVQRACCVRETQLRLRSVIPGTGSLYEQARTLSYYKSLHGPSVSAGSDWSAKMLSSRDLRATQRSRYRNLRATCRSRVTQYDVGVALKLSDNYYVKF